MLKTNIKATNITLTPAISDYLAKKLEALEKYPQVSEHEVVAQVEVGKSTEHHRSGDIFRAEIHLVGGGLDIYAVSEESDLYAAIDLVKDEIIHKLTHTKGREEALGRRGARMVKDFMRGLRDNIKGISFRKNKNLE